MKSGYINASQQRILRAVMCLAGHEVDGLAPTELARALRTSASNVTRDLANLQEAGFAEKIDSDGWRLTPKIVQISTACGAGIARAQDRLAETQQRFSRSR